MRLTLGGLRERLNNDGHSRSAYHPQCIAVMHVVQEIAQWRLQQWFGGSSERKTSVGHHQSNKLIAEKLR